MAPSTLITTRALAVVALMGSLISLCVGSSFAKTLFPVLGASGATVMRLVFGATVLVALWRPWRWPLTRRAATAIACYGLVLGLMNLLFFLAIARVPLALAIAIEFTGPLALALLSSRRALDFVWIGFAALGLWLLLPLHPNAGHLDPVGVLFAFGAAVCWALYVVTGQRAGETHGGQATSLGMLVGTLVVLPFGAGPAWAVRFDHGLLVSGAAVGLLSSAVPYSLEMVALKRLPRQTFSILLSMEPMVGALTAWIMLGEVLTPVQWLAIACIVVASAGSTLAGPTRAQAIA